MFNPITSPSHPTPSPHENPGATIDFKKPQNLFPSNLTTLASAVTNSPLGDTPPGNTPPGNVSSTLVLAPDSMAVDIYTFMAVFHKMAQEMRSANREIRASETQAQISELNSAAQEMQEAAKSRFAAACVQGAFQMAMSALSVGVDYPYR